MHSFHPAKRIKNIVLFHSEACYILFSYVKLKREEYPIFI